MERLRRTVVQLEEAKRFILDGEVARLRLAVILLDNAVEVMLHRRVSETLQHANIYARMLSKLPDGPLDAKGEELRQELSAELIPRSRQKQVNKYFGEKMKLLVEREGLQPAVASVLRHLHDYRNDVTPFDRLPSLPHWRSDVAALAGLNDKLELFDRFGTLEDDLEPLENGLQEVVDMISAAGELASDIARGA